MSTSLINLPVEHVDGELVDGFPQSETRRLIDLNIHHDHHARVVVDGTHATIGRILADERAHRQRVRDARNAEFGMFKTILAALAWIFGNGVSESSGSGGGDTSAEQSSSGDHSCTEHGDWSDYGYF